jgi:flagellar motor switch protein FliM
VKNGRYSVKIGTMQHPTEFLRSPLESARLGPSMMRSAEQGELYEQFDSKSANPAPQGVGEDTIGSIADSLEPQDAASVDEITQE